MKIFHPYPYRIQQKYRAKIFFYFIKILIHKHSLNTSCCYRQRVLNYAYCSQSIVMVLWDEKVADFILVEEVAVRQNLEHALAMLSRGREAA